jgi:hypothetical protein
MGTRPCLPIRYSACAFALSLCAAATPARAVIIYGPAGRNTSAPMSKALVDSGRQYEGDWNIFTGTPIAPNYFVTAGHIGGAVGAPFKFAGADYTTTAYYDDPSSDLRIWKVDGTFPTYAPLYRRKAERGKLVTLFGRGTERGTPVVVNKQMKGWRWGHLPPDNLTSWGTNTVTRIQNFGATAGDLLAWTFDAKRGNDEGALSVGDSGGGIFIKDGKTWKLAGVNYSVEGMFSLTPNPDRSISPDYSNPASDLDNPNALFNAALFDKGGIYSVNPSGALTLNRDLRANLPSNYYGTRIASNLSWIDGVLAGTVAPNQTATPSATAGASVPEPSTLLIGLSCAAGALLVHRRPR